MNADLFRDVSALQEANNIFDEIDIDSNGSVSYEELVNAFSKWHVDFNREDIDRIFKMCNEDHLGQISRTEFINNSYLE